MSACRRLVAIDRPSVLRLRRRWGVDFWPAEKAIATSPGAQDLGLGLVLSGRRMARVRWHRCVYVSEFKARQGGGRTVSKWLAWGTNSSAAVQIFSQEKVSFCGFYERDCGRRLGSVPAWRGVVVEGAVPAVVVSATDR